MFDQMLAAVAFQDFYLTQFHNTEILNTQTSSSLLLLLLVLWVLLSTPSVLDALHTSNNRTEIFVL